MSTLLTVNQMAAESGLSPEDIIDSIRSYIPNLAFARVNGAGHGIVLQEPEIVTYWILDFLGGVEKAKWERDNVPLQPLRKYERQ